VITDPTVVEPGSTAESKPGAVRYTAPELLDPTQFNLPNSNPSKESDIYSLAMTVYEVVSCHTARSPLTSPLCSDTHGDPAIRECSGWYNHLPGRER